MNGKTGPSCRPCVPPHFSHIIVLGAALLFAVFAGALMPTQAEVNGALSAALGDPFTTALISFGSGFAILIVRLIGSRSMRTGLSRVWFALRDRSLPRWYLLAGAMGTVMIMSQAATISVVGVALFTVVVVAGQVVSGLVVDSRGVGGATPRPLAWPRVLGATLVTVATVIAASANLSSPDVSQVLALAAPLAAGILLSIQMACNGSIARTAGSTWVAAFLNFATGTVVLSVVWVVSRPVMPAVSISDLPRAWWLYVGGALGVTVIAFLVTLVRTIGVFLLALSTIAGQLLGALILASVIPGREPPTPVTVAGVLLALAAAIVGFLPKRGSEVIQTTTREPSSPETRETPSDLTMRITKRSGNTS